MFSQTKFSKRGGCRSCFECMKSRLKHKDYRDNNKIECECGSFVVKYYLKNHLKTLKHETQLKEKQINTINI